MKIAFVDASSQFLNLCKSKLKAHNENNESNIEALFFQDPIEFINYVGTHVGEIDCALIDLQMPELNGFEVVKMLQDKCPDMKEIICSCDINEDEKLKSFMPKQSFSICNVIERFTGLKHLRNALELGIRRGEFDKGIVYG